MIDRGLWINNLPAAGRDGYLSWLHDIYIPRILKHPGVLWAAHYASHHEPVNDRSVSRLLRHTDDPAVPAGNDYVLLFGGETAHVFSKGAGAYLRQAPSRLHADLSEADMKMLAMRSSERVSVMTEVARTDGPEANQHENRLALSACIQLGTFNVGKPEWEDELLAWFSGWRFDALAKLPGSVRLRQMVSVSGWAKHGVLYEFLSKEGRNSHFPHLRKMYPVEGAWSDKVVPKLLHAPDSPFVGTRTWPPVG